MRGEGDIISRMINYNMGDPHWPRTSIGRNQLRGGLVLSICYMEAEFGQFYFRILAAKMEIGKVE